MKHLALILFAVLLCSCSEARRMTKKEARAAAILAEAQVKAAKICPWCVFQDSITTKADSAVVPMVYADIDHQGMLIQCREALEAARADLRNAPDTIRVPVQTLSPRSQKAVEAIRANICQFEPIVYDSDVVRVEVKPGALVPLVKVEEKGRKLACPPCVGRVETKIMEVNTWHRFAFGVHLVLDVVFVLLWLLFKFMKGAHRYDDGRP